MPTRICWSCQHDAHLTRIANSIPLVRQGQEWGGRWAAAASCDFCSAISVAEFKSTEANTPLAASSANEAFDGDFRYPIFDLEWQPKGAIVRKVEDVPEGIDEAAGEALAALAIGAYKATVVMCRAVIEATAKAHGIEVRGIAPKIDALKEQQIITPATHEAAHEVRLLANEMAHGDFATTRITEDEAQLVMEITEAMLAEVFQRPARLARAKQKRLEKQELDRRDT